MARSASEAACCGACSDAAAARSDAVLQRGSGQRTWSAAAWLSRSWQRVSDTGCSMAIDGGSSRQVGATSALWMHPCHQPGSRELMCASHAQHAADTPSARRCDRLACQASPVSGWRSSGAWRLRRHAAACTARRRHLLLMARAPCAAQRQSKWQRSLQSSGPCTSAAAWQPARQRRSGITARVGRRCHRSPPSPSNPDAPSSNTPRPLLGRLAAPLSHPTTCPHHTCSPPYDLPPTHFFTPPLHPT